MKKIVATAVSALALGTGVALASPEGHELEFPMTQDVFLETFDDATVAIFDQADTTRDGVISEDEFHAAVERGLIDDPRG